MYLIFNILVFTALSALSFADEATPPQNTDQPNPATHHTSDKFLKENREAQQRLDEEIQEKRIEQQRLDDQIQEKRLEQQRLDNDIQQKRLEQQRLEQRRLDNQRHNR